VGAGVLGGVALADAATGDIVTVGHADPGDTSVEAAEAGLDAVIARYAVRPHRRS